MSKIIVGGREIGNFCEICCKTLLEDANKCDGCQPMFMHGERVEPTHFVAKDKYKLIMEDGKMVVTICGSYSKKDEMLKCKEYFERFGHKVNCPFNPYRVKAPLITKQAEWIEKIEEADLVVAIAKDLVVSDGEEGGTLYGMKFGESTSYEMAIAMKLKKQIMIW